MNESARAIGRVRHEPKRRLLSVTAWEDVTPKMRRISLGGPDLEGFVSAAPDDHVKLFFPMPDGRIVLPELGPNGPSFPEAMRPQARDYTPRRYDPVAGRLDIDFVLHGDGPASNWAANVAIGRQIGLGGPRGSFVIGAFDYYLLVGDETALPAIGRRIEELPAGARVIALVEIADAGEEQLFATAAQLDLRYFHRDGAAPGTTQLLQQAVETLELPGGTGFHFVAGEAQMVRDLRALLVDRRGIDPDHLRASAYWHLGIADAHEH